MAKLYTKNTWDDEVLAGAERFDIKEDAGTAFKSNMQIVLATGVTTAGSPVSAARLNNLELGLDAVDTRLSDEIDLFTTAGTSTAYTITTTGAAVLATGEKFRVKFNATAGATPTLNRDSKGAKSLKYYDSTGAKVACSATSIISGMITDVIYDGTDYVVIDSLPVVGVVKASGAEINTGTDDTKFATAKAIKDSALNNYPDGTMRNGKILPSVASNNLTLALKTFAGTDPSATDPVFITIGGVVRTITAALSVTKNAATNWCNAGSAELATKEIDYFVYLGYNATDGVVLGFSRIPYANLYSDFSATTTNEKYSAISTITNAAAGDNYINIGRFAATLSAGAGYTWSVPTFTSANLKHLPKYETRLLNWIPVHTRTGTAYTNVPATNTATYMVRNRFVWIDQRHTQNATPGGTGNQQFTLPFTQLYATFTSLLGLDEYTPNLMTAIIVASDKLCRMFLYEGTTNVTASHTYSAAGEYAI